MTTTASTPFDEALAAGRLPACLEILQRSAVRAPQNLASLLRAALAQGDAAVAVGTFELWRRHVAARDRSLPVPALALGVRAYLGAGRTDAAWELFERGRALQPDFPQWPKLEEHFGPAAAATRAAATVAEVMARDGIVAARGLVEGWTRSPQPDWLAVALAGEALDDPVETLVAEERLGLDLESSVPDDVPEALLGAAFTARMGLAFFAEAAALATTTLGMTRPATTKRWRIRRLHAMVAAEETEAALDGALALHSEGVAQAVPIVARCLVRMGELDRLGAFLEEVAAGWDHPTTQPLERARILFHMSRGDRDRIRSLMGSSGDDTAGLQTLSAEIAMAQSVSDTAALDALLARVAAWRDRPGRLADLLVAGPQIVAAHHRVLKNWPRVEDLAQWLAATPDLPQKAARLLATTLDEAGRTGESTALVRRALRAHPRSPSLWLALVASEVQSGRDEAAAEARAGMRAALPARVYHHSVALADSRIWDATDVPDIFRYVAESRSAHVTARFFNTLRRLRLGEGQLDLLSGMAAGSPHASVTLEMLQAQARDRHRLEEATLEATPFNVFLDSRRRSCARIGKAVAVLRSAPDGPLDDAAVFRARALDKLARIEAVAAHALLDTADCYADALELARLIIGRIRGGEPTSVLRIGDGEGSFLPPAPEVADHMAGSREFIMRTWWGERRPAPDVLAEMEKDHLEAIRNATIVGVIPAWRLVQRPAHGTRAPGNWPGLYTSIAYVADNPLPGAVITSAHLHHDLQAWNLWREVFGEVGEISWISCHDLSDHMLATWGVRTRRGVLIPGEDRYFGAFGRHSERTSSPESLLDRHDEVRAALDPRPGEVWLVAGGFLGKIYCEDIRRRGGIAIDIGSLADYWMGFATRDYRLEDTIPVNLTNMLLDGHGIAPRDEHARIIGAAGPVRSTRKGRYNIGPADDATEPTPRHVFLQVIGHPRCASGFMATVFAANGVEIGHERLLRDGISSWMNVVRDAVVPWGDNGGLGTTYAHTVVHLRNPADAIPSIMLENGVERSFDFRRQHILRHTGDDIARYRTAIERAVASYVGWYEIALAVEGAVVIRIEEAEEAVSAFLAAAGPRDGETAAPAPVRSGMARSPLGDLDEADPFAPVNPSTRKFSRPKPTLDRRAYDVLDPALRDRFCALTERAGYRSAIV